jgi:uncharacterized protein YutE (UPF0331/DUF86 family)
MVADAEVEIDLRLVYQILQERLGDFDRYLIAIERYLAPRQT